MADSAISSLFASFKPFFILLGIVIGLRIIFDRIIPDLAKEARKSRKKYANLIWRSDRELLGKLRQLKPWEFEDYIAHLYSQLGYKTERVGKGYDKGVDVIAEKDGLKHYIQCKKYITSVVGVNELREFYGAIADHLAQAKGYFITTNKFTLEAEKFAENKPIELIDGYKLVKYIRMSEKSKLIKK